MKDIEVMFELAIRRALFSPRWVIGGCDDELGRLSPQVQVRRSDFNPPDPFGAEMLMIDALNFMDEGKGLPRRDA